MPIREDVLAPIAGDNPSGVDLRYDTKLLIFDKIKEARRQDDELNQGAWQSERKTANWPLVLKLAQDTLATNSKDLQLAAYLTEALLQSERFAGLRQGLDLTYRLLSEFWDSVYPQIEDGDREMRARPLGWIGSMLDFSIRSAPITTAGFSFVTYKESREVGYEDQAKSDKEKKTRATKIANGKVTPEDFDKAFNETPKAYYVQTEKDLDGCLEVVASLEAFCDEKLEDDSPGFAKLKTTLTEVRQTVHQLLEKKREKEPDPVEEVPVEEAAVAEESAPGETGGAAAGTAFSLAAEPADRRQAVGAIVAAAAFLRKREPHSPAPYLLLRGLRWGELRSSPHLTDSSLLEAPSTELRQQVKKLALARRWAELLEAGEQALALPGSRAWLDLQRLSVTACTALGSDYEPIATAIRSELRALLNDLPELLDAMLLDDTPAANPETRAWLQSLGTQPQKAESGEEAEAAEELQKHRNGAPAWLAPALDANARAKDALAAGRAEEAFAILRAELAKQRSGRMRFRRTMQMIELAVAAGRDDIAQPLLEDIAAAIENHKLDAWEDPEQMAADLTKLMRFSKKIQGNNSDKQKLFERICRLDPVKALNVG
ncbi:type VI secretion system protein TssA [Acidobacteria bacterium AB60]|nr:type VI secretion system protein TssA [Acidobacteria bacterium AB60]